MATTVQLRLVLPQVQGLQSLGPCKYNNGYTRIFPHQNPSFPFFNGYKPGKLSITCPLFSVSPAQTTQGVELNFHGGDGNGGRDDGNSGGGGGGHRPEKPGGGDSAGKGAAGVGIISTFLKGWQERVTADPQFPFKVLMEEIVGVGACVIGDMASRPNFGLDELDFVFSTVVVGSILNFSLMYMLAPTTVVASAAANLPGVFASCPPGHMFEHGAYSLFDRLGTFVYKGALFATVGFGAGLLGTSISNVLISLRKKMNPNSETETKAPPTVLNAVTWAIHMGVSSNLRYQVLNGLEFAMANVLSPSAFKASIIFTRAANNVLGGMTFVALARLTGSQKVDALQSPKDDIKESEIVKEAVEKSAMVEVESAKEVTVALLKEDGSTQ